MSALPVIARVALCCSFALGMPLHVALDHGHEAEHVKADSSSRVAFTPTIHCGDCGHSVHCPGYPQRQGPHHGHQVDAARGAKEQRIDATALVFDDPQASRFVEPAATPSVDASNALPPLDPFVLREINPRGPPSA